MAERNMSFEIRDKDLAGRIGRLKTKSGYIETPAFFPVINPVKQDREVPADKIMSIGFNQVITNAFIIKQVFGDRARELSVKKIINFSGVVMTDSGAYQLLRYGKDRIRIEPEEIATYQVEIGSDIAVIADIPTRDDSSYEEAKESVEETLRRARLTIEKVRESDVLWVLPIQGGVYVDLVARSAREASKIEGYGMYAIGSPVTVLEKYGFSKIVDMVAVAKSILPLDKPVHLFGGGHPLIIPLMVALGVDTFDSASYILYARDGRYMTEEGTYKITDLEYLPCECEVCSRYTPKELIELEEKERAKILAVHNLHVINRELKRVKTALKEGRLWELIEERARTHPSLREALNTLIKYVDWIERLDPRFKGDAHAIFLYDTTSYHRPELIRHRGLIRSILKERRGKIILLPGNPDEKPFRNSEIYRVALSRGVISDESHVLVYLPYFNLVPVELDQVYPYAQFEMPLTMESQLINYMTEEISKLISEKTAEAEITILTCSKYAWSKQELFKNLVKQSGKVQLIELCQET
ncbi:MAG: tRNA guanosine(15) transglycosylase TgtA [Zestosphaera sp.]